MKALIYNGPRDVSVSEVPDAKIEKPTDVLVKITRTNICGSDLHMYEGRTNVEKGKVLGHENLGTVIEVGDAVAIVKVGDRVVRGQQISKVGNADGLFAYHLHFDLTYDPVIKTVPGHWPGDNPALVRRMFVDPKEFIRQRHRVRE